MAILNWLRSNWHKGDPVRAVANATQANRIANILNGIEGVGCRIHKPTNAEGHGWKIIVDGSTDIVPPNDPPLVVREITVVTDVAINEAGDALEKKTRTIRVICIDDESTTSIVTLAPCVTPSESPLDGMTIRLGKPDAGWVDVNYVDGIPYPIT